MEDAGGGEEEEAADEGDRQWSQPHARPARAAHQGIAGDEDVVAGGDDVGNGGEGEGDVFDAVDEAGEQEGGEEADDRRSLHGSGLVSGTNADEEAEGDAGGEEDARADEQGGGVTLDADAEENGGDGHGEEGFTDAHHKVGEFLAQQPFAGAEVGGVDLDDGALLLFADGGDRRQHGGKYPENYPKNAGDDVERFFPTRVEPEAHFGDDLGTGAIGQQVIGADEELRGGANAVLDNAGIVDIGAIHQHLHFGIAVLFDGFGKAGGNDDGGFGEVTIDRQGWIVLQQRSGDELVAGKDARDIAAAELAVVKILDAEGNVFGLQADGVTVDQQHGQGQQKCQGDSEAIAPKLRQFFQALSQNSFHDSPQN